jgi:hypothetical protein
MHPSRLLQRTLILSLLLLLAVPALSGCSGKGSAEGHPYEMAPLHEMPADVQNSAAAVRESYQFAVANPDILKELPCYCGCGSMGHTSNYACYVSGVDASGGVQFDTHALGCSICVDITQDAMRLLKAGKTLPEIRAYVDDTYARYGPSNIP